MLSTDETLPGAVAVVVCAPDGAPLTEIQTVLEDTSFRVVARATDDLDLIAQCRDHRPQLVVVDEAAGPEAARTARRLAAERPMPVLLVVEREAPETDETDESLRVSTVARSDFQTTDPFARRRLRTRLRLLAARGHEPKTTLSKEGLRSMVTELMDEEPEHGAPPKIAALVTNPLDLVCCVVPSSAHEMIEQLFSRIETILVPAVLLAEEPDAVEAIVRRHRLGAVKLDATLGLRRATGLVLADSTMPVSFRPDLMAVGTPGTGSAEASLRTMQGLGARGLSLLLGPDALPTPSAHLGIRDGGGTLLRVLEPGDRVDGDGLDTDDIDVEGLVWLWKHLLPRRL